MAPCPGHCAGRSSARLNQGYLCNPTPCSGVQLGLWELPCWGSNTLWCQGRGWIQPWKGSGLGVGHRCGRQAWPKNLHLIWIPSLWTYRWGPGEHRPGQRHLPEHGSKAQRPWVGSDLMPPWAPPACPAGASDVGIGVKCGPLLGWGPPIRQDHGVPGGVVVETQRVGRVGKALRLP